MTSLQPHPAPEREFQKLITSPQRWTALVPCEYFRKDAERVDRPQSKFAQMSLIIKAAIGLSKTHQWKRSGETRPRTAPFETEEEEERLQNDTNFNSI